MARNKKRTDVRLFLTQRAIQSFVHLLLETRDPHTVRWIEVHQRRVSLGCSLGGCGIIDLRWPMPPPFD
jgi:hypothetical protein